VPRLHGGQGRALPRLCGGVRPSSPKNNDNNNEGYNKGAKGGKATEGGGSGNGAPDLAMRYCPPYVAPNKAGRPKEGKRKKGCLEEKKPKKWKGMVREATDDWNRKQSKGKQLGRKG
jgi:hypothetical protein